MTSQTVTIFPLTTRNYTNLLGLSAGANVGVFNAANLGRGTQDIAVNGSVTAQNNFQMDGASIVSIYRQRKRRWIYGRHSGIGIVNPDAIQEFKIQTSLYDAGYGRNPGANVNVVTKSGTNQFHGTAFEFFRNTDLNANDFFRKISPPVDGVPNNGRQVLNQNQYGGVFGGPVKKDKLFFFVVVSGDLAEERNCVRRLLPLRRWLRFRRVTARIPLLSRLRWGRHFARRERQAGKTCNGGTQVACNGSNINPVAINILQLKNPEWQLLHSQLRAPGQYTNATFSIPARFAEHQAIGNFDYVINSKNTLSGRWFYSRSDHLQFLVRCDRGWRNGPGTCLPGTGSARELCVSRIVS